MNSGDQPAGLMAPSTSTRLRALTPARVGLGRVGVSRQTRDVLDFQLCHAQARDAVHARMDAAAMQRVIAAIASVPAIRLHSAAPDRTAYLQRPDLGRTLDQKSSDTLAQVEGSPFDLALIVADGLSALAVERHVGPLLSELLPRLQGWKLAPVCVVEQGRVAVGDEIGFAMRAQISVVLIGERPCLSSPDSLGAYITFGPRPGRTDAERNCISNIRLEGLSYRDAAGQLANCVAGARRNRLTGTGEARRMLPEDARKGGRA
jgi:ethanolamine ammonia-lyase small subunit